MRFCIVSRCLLTLQQSVDDIVEVHLGCMLVCHGDEGRLDAQQGDKGEGDDVGVDGLERV